MYWEFPESGGQQAVRMGKWKALRKRIKKGNLKIKLYNLEEDIQELNDVADQYPRIIKKMEEIMIKEHVPSENKLYRMKALGD